MLGRPHGSWCGDYSGPAGLAKGVVAYRDIPHLLIGLRPWSLGRWVVRVGDLVKDGAKRRRLRRSL